MRRSVSRLWHGELSLRKAFWLYFIFGYFAAFLISTLLYAVLFFAFGRSIPPLLGILALSMIGYMFVAGTGVWRSATRYQGTRVWPALAKLLLIFVLCFFLLNVQRRFRQIVDLLLA